MPIKHTDHQGTVTVAFAGRVVAIREFKATRNLSDTLDYSDYQTVTVTEALVYLGRTADREMQYRRKSSSGLRSRSHDGPEHFYQPDEQLEPADRFSWVDCSNLFVWRGADKKEPWVDPVLHPDVVIDYCEYQEAQAAIAKIETERARAAEERMKAAMEEAERNRPVVGKAMRVATGRKVPVGTMGTVAFVRDDRVLLKPDATWRDRAADGVWVQARHLKAR